MNTYTDTHTRRDKLIKIMQNTFAQIKALIRNENSACNFRIEITSKVEEEEGKISQIMEYWDQFATVFFLCASLFQKYEVWNLKVTWNGNEREHEVGVDQPQIYYDTTMIMVKIWGFSSFNVYQKTKIVYEVKLKATNTPLIGQTQVLYIQRFDGDQSVVMIQRIMGDLAQEVYMVVSGSAC
ncbi:hypothetical protein ACJX0J_005517 [Zea mays]